MLQVLFVSAPHHIVLLEDVIYNISPVETPFMTMAGRKTATATYHE